MDKLTVRGLLFMKYQSFNRSCAYAGLANMLLEFSIDTEDFEIVKVANIPYIFQFDYKQNKFIAGPMIQGKKWFNYYLNYIGLEYIENEYSPLEVFKLFDSISHKCMLGLKITDNSKHAVVFQGIENEKYKFLNNKNRHSLEPTYYSYGYEELLTKLSDKVLIGWIENKNFSVSVDNYNEITVSLSNLNNYRYEVIEFCCKYQKLSSLREAKSRIFEAFLLDVCSMMEIVKEYTLANKIKELRVIYINAMKLNKGINLSNYLSMNNFDIAIKDYIKVLENRIQ